MFSRPSSATVTMRASEQDSRSHSGLIAPCGRGETGEAQSCQLGQCKNVHGRLANCNSGAGCCWVSDKLPLSCFRAHLADQVLDLLVGAAAGGVADGLRQWMAVRHAMSIKTSSTQP